MNWIPVNRDLIYKRFKSFIRTDADSIFTLEGKLSPYDIPNAIGVKLDKKADRVYLKFLYLTDEKKTYKSSPSGYVILTLGKDTKRIYGINFDRCFGESTHRLFLSIEINIHKGMFGYDINSPFNDRVQQNLELIFHTINDSNLLDKIYGK